MRLTEVVKGGTGQRTLVSVSVEEMRADVIDRSWDSQGTVTIGNVSVLDHISLGEEEREVGGGGREPREGEWNSIRTVELTLISLDARRKIIVLYGLQCLISMAETQLTSDPHQPVNWVKSHLLI